MRFNGVLSYILANALSSSGTAFIVTAPPQRRAISSTTLSVSIGLGPSQEEEQQSSKEKSEAEIVYEIPNHEEYRTSRRTKLDESCDAWYERLLGSADTDGILTSLAQEKRTALLTPVELVNDIEKDYSDPEWTPYVTTSLPWTPLVPAFGLEQFGMPVPRRNAETWRQFDVAGMVAQDYSRQSKPMTEINVDSVRTQLEAQGGWLKDDQCTARLVYIDGYYVDELSKSTEHVYNIHDESQISDNEELMKYVSRVTDGFTDELVVPVVNGETLQTSFQKLSGPDHNVGAPTTQFAINAQQGTACFTALNTIKTRSIAFVSAPAGEPLSEEEYNALPTLKPVLIINAITPCAGLEADSGLEGASLHPRTLVVAEEYSRLSVVQSSVDLKISDQPTPHVPKLYNGYSQLFIKAGANVTHSYLEESGGMVTPFVELSDEDLPDKTKEAPRTIEASRPELKDTHLEAIDVHCMGEDASYQGTLMSVGGSGRVRIAVSTSLLQTGSKAIINGFSLSGGAQRTDIKTNIHHVAQGTISHQTQKNMVGGRSTGSFRGRIRVEQSAQQTNSEQLSRTVLLSDRARAWAVPSLEIIADDVKCTHGTTVSDLSEEELFYLRSRGLDRLMARNLLMLAFAGDIAACVEPAMLGAFDSDQGLQKRLIRRLENLVPQGERAIKGEFQSI